MRNNVKMNLDVMQIKMLEIGKCAKMIEDENCYYLTVGHLVLTMAMFFAVSKWRLVDVLL